MKWSRMVYILLLLAAGLFLYTYFFWQAGGSETVELNRVVRLAQNGEIKKILVRGDQLEVTLVGGGKLSTYKESKLGTLETLERLGVSKAQLQKIQVEVAPPSWWGGWLNVLSAVLPLLLIGVFFFLILRQAQGAGNQALSFGKSRARMFTGDKPTVTFDD
ncbi:MAG: ATP-dependent metallopeptidase FtsH/Yme1/Tma family protein, partial [Anaerolineae bacterium]|nr:ATP-dependent metallopeptidase FtsH/Yme1/Tma family protein [Anaerolineae bacterium]